MAALPVARLPLVAAFLAGAATVFAFAPFELALLPVVTVGALMMLWQRATPRSAAALGFAFGAGLFGVGVSWVYIALHTFGDMPAPVAAIATFGFCAISALYYALVGAIAARAAPPDSLSRALLAAAGIALADWLRSWVLSGFPWLALGYAALPAAGPTPLAGFAPIGGVFLVSLAIAVLAALVSRLPAALTEGALRRLAGLATAAIGVIVVPALLLRAEWTAPTGAPIPVSLAQGNVAQDIKFDPRFRDRNYQLYLDLVHASRGRLVVLPESAFPVFADEVPETVAQTLVEAAASRDGAVLAGMFTAEPPLPGSREPRLYNSVVAVDRERVQLYRKRHLVPFGETIPIEPVVGWFIRSVLAIPLANQTPGPEDQPPLAVAGARVGVDICYEDVFGAELRGQAAIATLLVNVTNDAWYGRSLAARQHNQIGAMRALEAGRPMLRATNTGITSAFDHRGRELARLPWFATAVLEVEVTGREGLTPYVRWGDGVAVVASLIVAAAALVAARKHGGNASRPA